MERFDKLIARAFDLSRSQAQQAIRQGRASAGGEICRAPERKFDAKIPLSLDGGAGKYKKYVYVMLDKPAGYLSATEDRRGPTVADLLPEELRRRPLGVVGRLDKDATGLVLMTDDGELNHRLTSPKYHMDKLYRVRVDGPLDESDVNAFASGMDLSDFTAMPAGLEIDNEHPDEAFVTIKEGKFHQIKRMFAQRGREVLELRRLAIGGLRLDEGLGNGNFRHLTDGERQYLEEKCAIKQ